MDFGIHQLLGKNIGFFGKKKLVGHPAFSLLFRESEVDILLIFFDHSGNLLFVHLFEPWEVIEHYILCYFFNKKFQVLFLYPKDL